MTSHPSHQRKKWRRPGQKKLALTSWKSTRWTILMAVFVGATTWKMAVRYLLRSMMGSLTNATKDIMCVQIVTSRGTVQRHADQQTIDSLVKQPQGTLQLRLPRQISLRWRMFHKLMNKHHQVPAAQLVTQYQGSYKRSLPLRVLLRRERKWKMVLQSQQAHRRSFTTSVSKTSSSLRYALDQLDWQRRLDPWGSKVWQLTIQTKEAAGSTSAFLIWQIHYSSVLRLGMYKKWVSKHGLCCRI